MLDAEDSHSPLDALAVSALVHRNQRILCALVWASAQSPQTPMTRFRLWEGASPFFVGFALEGLGGLELELELRLGLGLELGLGLGLELEQLWACLDYPSDGRLFFSEEPPFINTNIIHMVG